MCRNQFRLSAKRTSPFKSAGASVQSVTGSRGLRISGSNAGYTMLRGSVKGTGYPPPFASFPFTSPPVRHRVPSHFNLSLPIITVLTEVMKNNLYILKKERWTCPAFWRFSATIETPDPRRQRIVSSVIFV